MEVYIRSTNIIGDIKLWEMRYVGHVEGMYETKNGCSILFKDPKENVYLSGKLKVKAWVTGKNS
jgi:hypothetical protein